MNLVLGRIIVDEKFIGSSSFNEINIKVVELLSEYTENFEIPTLIVGWEKVKGIFGDNVSILNKRIRPNLYWTFAPNEKLQSFIDDTNKYINELYNDFIKDYEYYFIDPIVDDIQNIGNIIRFLYKGECDSIYMTEDFIYMYNSVQKIILGIDVHYYEMLGFKINKNGTKFWNDETIEIALNEIIKKYGKFPTAYFLESIKRSDLIHAVQRNGGFQYWRKKLGYA